MLGRKKTSETVENFGKEVSRCGMQSPYEQLNKQTGA